MHSINAQRTPSFFFLVAALVSLVCPGCHGQAALLMEEPYGISAVLNPTGHEAFYFARICAATPIKLRRCGLGETGTVIARYHGIAGYDWVAMPLVPYLYSVEDASAVPQHVDGKTVAIMRWQYHDAHLLSLGKDVPIGDALHRGWDQLVGAAYQRRIYAFRFATSPEQDDAFIARMNADMNKSHFNLVFHNCANFTGGILNFYFPHTFRRLGLPDAWIVTPRQISYTLVRYARKHPETHLTVLEIPQIPGYRHLSVVNKSIAESLITTGYIIPLAVLNPYIAAGILVDYIIWGRYPINVKHAQILTPDNMAPLTSGDNLPTGQQSCATAETRRRGGMLERVDDCRRQPVASESRGIEDEVSEIP
jgi:hypothetical protein